MRLYNGSKPIYPLRSVLLAVLILIAAASPAKAQGRFPFSLTLKAAVDKALAASPEAKVADSHSKIADWKIREARAARKPIVQFSQSAVVSNNPVFVFGSLLEQGRFSAANFALDSLNNPSAIPNFRSLVSTQMPVFDQRQTKWRVEQAKTAKSRADLEAEAVRQKLRFDVVRTFYGAVLEREMLKVSDEAVRSATANSKKTKDMVEVGLTTDADFLAAEVELADAGQKKLEAESGLVITTAALNLLLGDEPGRERYLIGDLQERYFPLDDQDELIRTALANRPDYLSAEMVIENSRRQTRSVRDLRLPRVDAFGSVGYSSQYIANGSTDYTVGVSLTYTLFDAGRRSRVEQAAEAELVAEGEKQVLANRISLEVVRAAQGYQTARSKIQVSVKSIAQAEEALRIVQDRYKFGLTTFNEVLRSESAFVRAKHNLLTARYEYYVAFASLLHATGKLTDVRLFN